MALLEKLELFALFQKIMLLRYHQVSLHRIKVERAGWSLENQCSDAELSDRWHFALHFMSGGMKIKHEYLPNQLSVPLF